MESATLTIESDDKWCHYHMYTSLTHQTAGCCEQSTLLNWAKSKNIYRARNVRGKSVQPMGPCLDTDELINDSASRR